MLEPLALNNRLHIPTSIHKDPFLLIDPYNDIQLVACEMEISSLDSKW